jgi:predicted nucleic acid-binding protein
VKVFVDTSALIALLDEDDRRHTEAGAIFRSLAATAELVTHNYVHVEAIALARQRLGRGAVERLIDVFLPLMTIAWVDEASHREAIAAQRSGAGALSIVDQVSFAVMRTQGLEIAFAFDPDFEAAGFTPASAPEEARGPRRLSEQAASYGAAADQDDLVSVSEIAARTGHPVNTIQSWRRRHSDFPAPIAQLAAGPIWSWGPIKDWIEARDRSRLTAAVNRVIDDIGADAASDPFAAEAARRLLQSADDSGSEMLPLPPEWRSTFWGQPMPDVAAAVRRSREEH